MKAEKTLLKIQNIIKFSIKENSKRGFVDCRGCDNVCVAMHECLDICEAMLEDGEYQAGLDGLAYVLTSSAELSSFSDSSSGTLIAVMMRTGDVIEKNVVEIAGQGRKLKAETLNFIIGLAKNEVFDDLVEWRYNLLRRLICICDKRGGEKVEELLDSFLKNMEKRAASGATPGTESGAISEYEKKENTVVRCLLHRHLLGKKAAKAELYENLHIDELRNIAIEDALKVRNYSEAERLCAEKAQAEQWQFYRKNDPTDWNNRLYSIYEMEKAPEKQAAQAKKLLLLGNDDFWDIVKEFSVQAGTWEKDYPKLLEMLKNSEQIDCYRRVLLKENEMDLLMEAVEKDPRDLEYYGEFLVEYFPEKIYELCYRILWEGFNKAITRKDYQKLVPRILLLIKWKGDDTARRLIDNLKTKYKGKPALHDELDKAARYLRRF